MMAFKFWAILMYLVSQHTHVSNGTQCLTAQHNILVRSNTEALFPWTHSSRADTYISWYYKATDENSDFVYIMSLSPSTGVEKAPALRARLSYIPFPGSAMMLLKNVTASDEGEFKVQISDMSDEQCTHVTTLTTISEKDAKFDVFIGHSTLHYSADKFESDVTLRPIEITPPAAINVSVRTSDVYHNPNINIRHKIRKNIHEGKICEQRLCQSQINFDEKYAGTSAEILITVKCDIQQMDVVNIVQPVIMQTKNELPHDAKMSWDLSDYDLAVLHGTTATFNWTFSDERPLHIAWFYKGTKNHPNHLFIMGRAQNTTTLGEYRERLAELNASCGPGMILRNVTRHDVGLYAVEAMAAPGRVVFSGEMYLRVIEASELTYSTCLDGLNGNYSVEENGWNVVLPTRDIVVPNRVEVIVRTMEFIPRPTIAITVNLDGISHPELQCDEAYTCMRLVPIFSEYITNMNSDLDITIRHSIQNVDVINIRTPMQLASSDDATCRTRPTCYRVCIIGIILLSLGTGMAWLLYKKRLTSQSKSETSSVSDEETQGSLVNAKPQEESKFRNRMLGICSYGRGGN